MNVSRETQREQPDEVTTFIISHMVRLDTFALIRIRDSVSDALARPKPWKRDADLRRIREAMDDELSQRSRDPGRSMALARESTDSV